MADEQNQNAMTESRQAIANAQAAIMKIASNIGMLLPKPEEKDRFLRICANAVISDPKIAQCTLTSLQRSVVNAATVGLEVNTPLQQAWLVPFRNYNKALDAKVLECQLLIGYQGFVELLHRGCRIKSVWSYCVYENDEFSEVLGSHPGIIHKPNHREDRGRIIGAYACAELISGAVQHEYLSLAEIEKMKDASPAARGGKGTPAWKDWFEEMARKCPIRRLQKYLPKNPADEFDERIGLLGTRLQKALEFDDPNYNPNQIEHDDDQTPEARSAAKAASMRASRGDDTLDAESSPEPEQKKPARRRAKPAPKESKPADKKPSAFERAMAALKKLDDVDKLEQQIAPLLNDDSELTDDERDKLNEAFNDRLDELGVAPADEEEDDPLFE